MHVDHRELFRHAGRRIVERQRVAHHADRRIGGAARQRRGDQVGRRHQAVAVGMMLVHADRVEAALGGVFQLVHEVVVHVVRAPGIEQRRMDVHPHRGLASRKSSGSSVYGIRWNHISFMAASGFSIPASMARPLLACQFKCSDQLKFGTANDAGRRTNRNSPKLDLSTFVSGSIFTGGSSRCARCQRKLFAMIESEKSSRE